MSEPIDRPWIKVWDPLVRYGHWALAGAFAIAYVSAEEEGGGSDQLHIWSGYAVGIIVAVRIVWGLVGTKHARFSDFLYSPIAALRYLGDLVCGQARRYIGHSPIGAAMVLALLLSLSGTVVTGIAAYGDNGTRPFANSFSLLTAPAHAEEEETGSERQGGEGGESVLGELHEAFSKITVGLVILHVLGVGLASVAHRENLVGAMISGRKRSGDEG